MTRTAKTLLTGLAFLACAGVFALYTQPSFLVHLADQIWACF